MSAHTRSRPPPPARNAMSAHTRWGTGRSGPLPVKRQLRGGICDEHAQDVDAAAALQRDGAARGEGDNASLSVAHLTSAGNRVELGHAEGRIVNLTTGRSIALERRGGVYILRMFIADPAAQLPFHRQGA